MQNLKRASAYNRSLIEASLDPMVTISPDGKITDVNHATEKVTGHSRKELVDSDFSNYFADPDKARAIYQQVFKKGFVLNYPLNLKYPDGHLIPVLYNASVYHDENGKVVGVFAVARDITDRKKTEDEIKKHATELENVKKALLNVMEDLEISKSKIEAEKLQAQAMLSSIGDGVVAINANGEIIMINKSAKDMLHCKSTEAIGKKPPEVWTVEDNSGRAIPIDGRPIQRVLSSGKTITTTCYYVRRDKTKFPVALTATPVLMNGKVIGIIDIFRDITKEREIDKAKTEFVSLASHQLRTPLSIIKWYLEAIKEESYFKNAPKTISTYLVEIYKSNERVISLVRNLLSISRIDQRRVKDSPQDTDLIQLIKDIVKEMGLLATPKNIRLSLAIKVDTLPTIFIDPFRLREVIENLITNAITYNAPAGSVEVIVDKKNDNVLISVKDTGIGLSEEDQKKLFTKFFRSEKAVLKNPDGSGLGLYVVKSYIEDWGGKISVISCEGEGSTFTVTMPLKPSGMINKEDGKEVSKI